ncbi:MAG: J domain-containing protein [Oxalobacteraceae bacterium]|nr:MAG: J domain-containing protein [Oxalobacteraceae bacterium]
MAFSPDYYAVLGVPPGADRAAIHAAWKALLRRYHPDVNHGADVSARAKEINEAYAVLGKKEARAVYDRSRTTSSSSRRPTAHRPVYATSAGRRSARPSATMRSSDRYSQPLSANDWLTGMLLLILTAAPLGTILVLLNEESQPTYTIRHDAAVHRR